MVGLNTIAAAAALGLKVWLDGDLLVVRGREEHQAHARRILAHKSAVVALLRAHPEYAAPGGLAALAERYEERAAIREFDGGLSRKEAERLAWDDVIGKAVALELET